MRPHISPAQARNNERILDRVEVLGGGYVWDAQVFTVMLMHVALPDAEARQLAGLVGVSQIAMDASAVSFSTLALIDAIPGLESLVLCNAACDAGQLASLRSVVLADG